MIEGFRQDAHARRVQALADGARAARAIGAQLAATGPLGLEVGHAARRLRGRIERAPGKD